MRHQHLGLAGVASALALLAACAGGIALRESQQEERDRFAGREDQCGDVEANERAGNADECAGNVASQSAYELSR